MASRLLELLLILAATIAVVVCQNQCSSINIRTCGECISVSGCAWCFQEGFTEHRCQPIGNFSAACEADNIDNPRSSVTRLNKVQVVESSTIDLDSADLSLRVGNPVSFKVEVTPRRNLPLDLYILIDLSGSMAAELATIQQVASSIASNVQDVTNNVRIGLGAFNDKIARPFFDVPVEDTCDNVNCASYAFRNVISLTNSSTVFANSVRTLTTTENADSPENGLEGLAQVIACDEIIGWRAGEDGSITKLVLFMTDNVYHYAGEGRLAGIVKPYNGECLLLRNPVTGFMEFTRFNEYDYPSVGQILYQMETFDLSVIFAVATSQVSTYENLIKLLNTNSRRSSVNQFSPGDNATVNERAILELINREYMRLLQEVSLVTSDSDLEITFTPTCPQNSVATDVGCAGVAFDEAVPFSVTVNLKTCNPADHGTVRTHNINSPSFGSFEIRYTIICDCGCSQQSFFDPNQCSGMGNRSCGVCVCSDDRCGVNCDRTLDRANVDCPTGGLNEEICSGPDNGVCDCGCRCNVIDEGVISGEACQCDNFRCPDSKDASGRTCHGNGLCCSGNCACYYVNATTDKIINPDPTITVGLDPNDRYRSDGSFEYCQCDSVNRACRQSPDATLCNGNGMCGCNFCLCNPMYKGFFCELPGNDSCGFPMDADCILECREAANSESEIPDMCSCNPTRPVLYINEAELNGLNSADTRQYYENVANSRLDGSFQFVRDQCTITDKDNCLVDYVILANETHSAIVANRQRDCSQANRSLLSIPTWALAIILLGCLLIIGIFILVLIKIILRILDYLELKRWEREAKDADFSKNQNPLYQSPEMKYENVAYGRE